MYKLNFEDENQKILGTIELNELEDIYQPSDNQKQTEPFILADVFDKSAYGMNILKPSEYDDDFIFIYTSSTFWDFFKPKLHEYNMGRLFKQTFQKFKEFGFFKDNIKEFVQKDSRIEGLLKLYDENNKLLKVWS